MKWRESKKTANLIEVVFNNKGIKNLSYITLYVEFFGFHTNFQFSFAVYKFHDWIAGQSKKRENSTTCHTAEGQKQAMCKVVGKAGTCET